MAREIYPFSFGDDTNPHDVDFRPQRVSGDELPKDSSAPESATDSSPVTTAPEPVPATSPDSEASASTPPEPPSDAVPSTPPAPPEENVTAEKAPLQPITLPVAPPTVPAPKRAASRKG